jgi:hypothetical protein
MAKPGRREHTPSDEIARFTDRDDQRNVFHRHLNFATEPPVLMFYGIGGAGKTWLLKKLRLEMPGDVPAAYLDFDAQAGGRRFALDPAAGLCEIRQQIDRDAPRFDLAFAMLRHKQGAAEEPGLRGHGALGLAMEIAAECVQAAAIVPGVNVALNRLRPQVLKRIKGSSFERFLARDEAGQFVLELRARTSQEIGDNLADYLAADLRESLTPNLGRAVRAVLFFDTFEAAGAGMQNTENRRSLEKWIRDVAANFDFALTVVAGQNRLDWEEAEPDWAENLEQHLVGGLSETDARQFLRNCEIDGADLAAGADATLRRAGRAGGILRGAQRGAGCRMGRTRRLQLRRSAARDARLVYDSGADAMGVGEPAGGSGARRERSRVVAGALESAVRLRRGRRGVARVVSPV